MARKKRWIWGDHDRGISVITLHSWRYLHDFVYQEMLDYSHYVWRGHRCDNWSLSPSIDRLVSTGSTDHREKRIAEHLDNFKFAVRGRRGSNPSRIRDENEWWALGQHNGLATPLLDWTQSPFVALYFAFIDGGSPQTGHRALYAVNRNFIENRSRKIEAAHRDENVRAPICELIRPMTDENSRLVNQGGLFSRTPTGTSLEQWVQEQHKEGDKGAHLIKLLIPNKERVECIRTLNKMNINHLTLFPDVYGASKHSNLHLTIPNY